MQMPAFTFSPVLYAACVTPLKSAQLYQAAYASASPVRKQKTDCFRFLKDRRLSLGVELLLRHALRSAEAGELPSEFIYNAQGKPCFNGNFLHFNLSHSEDWAICALAPCEVGCDV